MTCKLYKEAYKSFKHLNTLLNMLGMRIENYKIIYIVNQIYLAHLHGLHYGVKNKKEKRHKKETNRVWLLLLHNFKQIVLKISRRNRPTS